MVHTKEVGLREPDYIGKGSLRELNLHQEIPTSICQDCLVLAHRVTHFAAIWNPSSHMRGVHGMSIWFIT